MLLSRLSQSGLGFAVAGVAALGFAVAVLAPEAKAACIGGNSICSTFTTDTVSTPSNVAVFTGVGTGTAAKVKIRFDILNFSGPAFTLSGISITGPGITTSIPSPAASLLVNGDGLYETGFINLNTPQSSPDFSNYAISFTIPSGVGIGTSIDNNLRFFTSSNGVVGTSSSFTTTAVVPGPLPLMGAGVAFGFSRRLRRRIASAV